MLVALNFSATEQSLDLDSASQDANLTKATTLITTSTAEKSANGKQRVIQLSPYAVYIARIGR
jgi:hypothetical protein